MTYIFIILIDQEINKCSDISKLVVIGFLVKIIPSPPSYLKYMNLRDKIPKMCILDISRATKIETIFIYMNYF